MADHQRIEDRDVGGVHRVGWAVLDESGEEGVALEVDWHDGTPTRVVFLTPETVDAILDAVILHAPGRGLLT